MAGTSSITRLDHGASLTAFDERKLQPFASAADGGYPELSPWLKFGMLPGCGGVGVLKVEVMRYFRGSCMKMRP